MKASLAPRCPWRCRSHAALLAASLAMYCLAAPRATAQVSGAFGVKFGFPSTRNAYAAGTNNLTLPSNAKAGVVPLANWNNLLPNDPPAANRCWTGLRDSAGTLTPVSLTTSGINTGGSLNTQETNCLNAGLMFDWWGISGKSAEPTLDDGVTCTFSNLPAGSYYDIYIYLPSRQGLAQYAHLTADAGASRYYFTEFTPRWSCSTGFYTGTALDPNDDYPFVDFLKLPSAATGADGTLTLLLTPESTGTVGLAGVQVVPVSPMSLLEQPANVTAYAHAQASFSVRLSGGAWPISYEWRKVAEGATNIIQGATNATLVIPAVDVPNSGERYFALATDALGQQLTSGQAALSVVPGSPQALSIQFLPGAPFHTPNQPLAADDSTGVFPATHWDARTVVIPGDGTWSTNAFADLHDQEGRVSSVKLEVLGASDGWRAADPSPDSAPITRLLNTFVRTANPGAAGTALGQGRLEFHLGNLQDSQNYDVYVYLLGAPDTHPNVDSTSGQAVYSGQEFGSVDQASHFVPCFNTSPTGPRNQANYVQLLNLQPARGSITVGVQYDPVLDVAAGANLGVCGLQVIQSDIDTIAPTVEKQPANQAVYANTPASFTLTAAGKPAPQITWYCVQHGLTNALPSATNDSCVIPAASAALDGAAYFAVLSNTAGEVVTSQATLTVAPGSPTGILSVQFQPKDLASVFTGLSASDDAGALPAGNWQVLPVQSDGSDQLFSLQDSRGIGTPAQLLLRGASASGYLSGPAPDAAPITRLLNTFVRYGFGPAWPSGPNLVGNGAMQLILTNLDDTRTYNAYVYLADDWPDDYAAVDAGAGHTNYLGPAWRTVNQFSNFVASVNQDGTAVPDRGNYVHLSGITPTGGVATLTINYLHPAGQHLGVGVCGFQWVEADADLVPIAITAQPLSQRVLTNTMATFAVRAVGSPIEYQWYVLHNGATNPLPGECGPALSTGVAESSTGDGYFVVASNLFGSVTSQVAVITAAHRVSPAVGRLQADQFFGKFPSATAALSVLSPKTAAPSPPDRTEYLSVFDDNQDLPENSGQRIFGWFTAPATGNYVFFLASADAAALWLSPNADPAYSCQLVQNQQWMSHLDWSLSNSASPEAGLASSGEWRSDRFQTNGGRSAFANLSGHWSPWPNLNRDGTIPLVGGNKYYIELDHFHGSGRQNAAVTYRVATAAEPVAGTPSRLVETMLSTLSAPDYSLPWPRPVIVSAEKLEGGFLLSGTNGLANAIYQVWSNTNAAAAASTWNMLATQRFDTAGRFSALVPWKPEEPRRFYRLEVLP